jgi:adenylate cyclase
MPGFIESQASLPSSDARTREIRAYVNRLLATPQFAAASRRGQLLSYLIDHTLAGDADKISEYAIGLDVFQKPTSFDPRIESLVRTEFSRLRQRLKEYYAEDGRSDAIVIDFPPRSYAASFEFRNIAELPKPVAVPQPASSAKPAATRWAIAVTALLVLAIAVAGYGIWKQHASQMASKQPIHALVVLPFADFSENHQDEYIADGMTEELTSDLAQLHDLRVVARTSAFAFKGKGEDVRNIGKILGVDAVLEGSFTKAGDQVRITAQLNRTSDGYHVWSHSYIAAANDLLTVEGQVATAITGAIGQIRGGSLPPIEIATTNPEAHDLYLQGMYQFHLQAPQSVMKAAQLFQAAIDKDPDFARAYLALADAQLNAAAFSVLSNQEVIPRIRPLVEKAIALDPKYGNAYGDLALIDYNWDWNWTKAEAEYNRALQLGAGSETHAGYGWSLATRGRFEEAHEQFRQAAELDPLAIAIPYNEFFAYNFERDAAGQRRAIAQMQRLEPSFIGTHGLDLVMMVEQHDCSGAAAQANWVEKRYPALSVTQSLLAFAAGCAGDKPEALRHIKRMVAMKAQAYQVAIAYALIHDVGDAIAQLNKSADQHEGQILYIKYDPFFDEMRADARFVALEKRVGLM